MDDAKDPKSETPPNEPVPETPAEPGSNGDGKRTLAQDPLTPAVLRFARYFNKPVALQLKRPLLMLDYAGQMEIETQRYGLLGPAQMMNRETGQHEPVGSTLVLPTVVLNPSPNGADLVAWIQSPETGAMIEVLIAPEDIEFVTYIARCPPERSALVLPQN